MATALRVLIVEDNATDAELVVRELRRAGFDPSYSLVQTREDYAAHLNASVDVILSDYRLPQFCAEDALHLLQQSGLEIPFIIISGAIGEDVAIRFIKAGCSDYLLKDRLARLGPAVAHALEERQLRLRHRQAEMRQTVFSNLGQQLSAVVNPVDAGKIIVEIADKLFGWDACTLHLYSPEEDTIEPLINIDLVEGKRVDVPAEMSGQRPTRRMQDVIQHGKQLILRDGSFRPDADVVVYGDTTRLSASIMIVPIRNGPKLAGLLSIQSYKPQAYNQDDIEFLQVLADFCGGALERIRVQNSLRESEQRFHQITENIREVFWMTDPRLPQVLYVSPAFESIWGRSSDDLRRDFGKYFDYVVADDLEIVRGFFERQKSENCEAEYRIQRSDGAIRYIRDRAFPIWDGSGTVTRVARIAEDATERRRARLRTSAFSSLGERLNSATKPEEAAQIIVETAEKLFGWDSCFLSLYSMQDRTIRSLLTVDTIDGKKKSVRPSLDGRPSPRMLRVIEHGAQLILHDSDDFAPGAIPFGSGKPSASLMFVPIRKTTQVVGVLSVQSYTAKAYNTQDLETLQALADYCGGALERIGAEERLAYQADLLAHVNDAIIATNESGVLTSWNHAAEEMYGWKAEEAIGRELPQVVRMELTDGQRAEMHEDLARTGRCRIEAKHFRRDRRAIYVETTTIALRGESGQITGYASVSRDVTKRRQLEEQLRHSQKMDAFGQLAGGVAHDFNNLLTVIGGYTGLLLAREKLDEEVREEIALIAGAAEKATNLTRQLLTLGRKKEMQLTPVNLNEVVSNLTKMLHRLLGEEIRLKLVYAPALPAIQADTSMLEQVLLNLTINARDAMLPKGGDLFISTSACKIDENYGNPEARPGPFVQLAVKDTGCGMTPEVLARIFEPFFTTKALGKGTGLGLATVYGIVKQHRGWIEATSEPGAGSTFTVFLPADAPPRASTTQPASDHHVRGGRETILLVEDEPAVRGLARQILQRHGYHIIEAEDGVHALEAWKQHRDAIALVVTDMVMPGGMNGRDLAMKLQEDKPDLRIIYVSGYSVNLNDIELRDGWNFLQKPYPPKKLAKAVRDRLDAK